MEQATLDYYEPIFLEVVKRNSRWLTTEELCEELGTSPSSWLKSDVRNHPVVVSARRTDTRPYKYKADHIEDIQKVWDERKRGKR